MLGGAWYDQVIGDKDTEAIYKLVLDELKKHLKFDINPNYYEISLLKVDFLE
jgi:hypothetical protein